MVSGVTSGGNIAKLVGQQLPQIQNNNNQQGNQPNQVQQAQQPQHTHKAAPTVNTQGQVTGSVINTTA